MLMSFAITEALTSFPHLFPKRFLANLPIGFSLQLNLPDCLPFLTTRNQACISYPYCLSRRCYSSRRWCQEDSLTATRKDGVEIQTSL